jgi:NADPH:quinone reductase-like Zn-dependent oxidoreductase
VLIAAVYALDEAADAHRQLRRHVVGRIVLRMPPGDARQGLRA